MNKYYIKKEDVLWNHPDIFAQLVWRDGIAVVETHRFKEGHYSCTSEGLLGFLDIPKYLLNPLVESLHFRVEEPHKLGMGRKVQCLCLNGSAHANMTDDRRSVTCKTCLKIMDLEDGGMERVAARTVVIDAIAEGVKP